jgi:phage gpG-like protein
MIDVTITGGKELQAKLLMMPDKVNKSLTKAITILTLELKDYIIRNKLSGQVLNHRTGRLWRSIQQKVSSSNNEVIGTVFSAGDVKYAAIHEYGGTTPPHIIEPKTAKALYFNGRFAMRVNHPGSKMPERSYMRSSLRDYQSKIQTSLNAAIAEGIK